ncbi:MAG: hypothetical protein U0935_09705 [Pirellulales bacterium]
MPSPTTAAPSVPSTSLTPVIIGGRLVGTLLVIAILLCLVSFAGQVVEGRVSSPVVHKMTKWIDVNSEGNLPTWYSTVLIALAALLSYLAARAPHPVGQTTRGQWYGLTLAMLFVAADEGAQIHEKINVLLKPLHGQETYYFAWVGPWSALVVVLALLFGKFLRGLPFRHRYEILVAGAVYVGGALGVECIEAACFFREDGVDLRYEGIATVQELLEMVGMTLFIHAVIGVLSEQGTIPLQFHSDSVHQTAAESVACPKPIIAP